MDENYAANFSVGAQAGNMRVMQQMRMQELRSAEALQRIQERQLSAQADMLTQHAKAYAADAQLKEQQAREEMAVTQASIDMHAQLVKSGLTEEKAAAQTLAAMSVKFPMLAQKLSSAYENMRQGQVAGEVNQSAIAENLAQADSANATAELRRAQATQVGVDSTALPTGVRTAQHLAGLKEKLEQENNRLMESGVGEQSADSAAQRTRIARLQNEITALEPKKHESVLDTKMELLRKANSAVEQAAASDDTDALMAATAERDQIEALVYPKGTKLQGVNPVTGKSEARIAGGTTAAQDDITAKVRSDLQTQVNSSVQAARSLHDMAQGVDWTTVGPVAWTLEKAGRYGPGSLLGVAGQKSAGKRAEIKGATLDLMQELEVKGHASKAILEEVKKTLPSTGFFESPEAAKLAVQDRKRSFIVNGLTAAKQLGVKPPSELMQLLATYPSKELQRMASTGVISEEDASAAFALQLQAHPTNPNVTPTPKWAQ